MMKKKKTHGVQLLVRAIVRDLDGKVITDTGRKPARSFVIQFLEFFHGLYQWTTPQSATDTSGVEHYIAVEAYPCMNHLRIDNIVNNSLYGVVVGTGDTAESNTDYKLATQLTEGVTAGKITHGAVSIGTTGVVGANVDLEIKRAFTNGTGSTITVKESGIYTKWYYGTDKYYHCIVRDVLPASVEVPDKCSLTIIYTIRTTV